MMKQQILRQKKFTLKKLDTHSIRKIVHWRLSRVSWLVGKLLFVNWSWILDGYAQDDLELEMIGGHPSKAIRGIEKLQLPQFEVHKHQFTYRIVSNNFIPNQ